MGRNKPAKAALLLPKVAPSRPRRLPLGSVYGTAANIMNAVLIGWWVGKFCACIHYTIASSPTLQHPRAPSSQPHNGRSSRSTHSTRGHGATGERMSHKPRQRSSNIATLQKGEYVSFDEAGPNSQIWLFSPDSEAAQRSQGHTSSTCRLYASRWTTPLHRVHTFCCCPH